MAQESLTRRAASPLESKSLNHLQCSTGQNQGAVSNWYGKEWWDWSKFASRLMEQRGALGLFFYCGVPGSPIYKWGNAHVRRSGSGRREALSISLGKPITLDRKSRPLRCDKRHTC